MKIGLVTVALAASGFFAARSVAVADPAPVTVTVTTTVEGTADGWPASRWAARSRSWHRRFVQADRNSRARGRTVAKLRHANSARLQLGPDGLTSAFLCIHTFEGPWTAATGNGYYGGVQADRDFMQTYGGAFYRAWGTADHWPAFIQIAVAETAYLSGRGFGPWPNTARSCGLL